MSEENLYKQKFEIKQWPTRSVTLYPTRATVVRQIEGVKLKTGLNEITISNLTSLADPDSIRVSGSTDNQQTRISDLIIDLVPNKYSALYDFSDSESESDEEDEESPESLKAAQRTFDKMTAKIEGVIERRSSAEKELELFEQYAITMASATGTKILPDPKTMKETADLYNAQRKGLYYTFTACTEEITDLEEEKEKRRKELAKEKKRFTKANRKKVEAKEKKQAEKEEKKREKKEMLPEKLPNVYRVRITIDLPASESEHSEPASGDVMQGATLNMTYTTSSASWTPHYDVRLDTTNPSLSTLTYRAHFTNSTSEEWTNASITLSTSQASFGGLNEKIPKMERWRVTLAKKHQNLEGENGLYSIAEIKAKEEEIKAANLAPYERVALLPMPSWRHAARIPRPPSIPASRRYGSISPAAAAIVPPPGSSMRRHHARHSMPPGRSAKPAARPWSSKESDIYRKELEQNKTARGFNPAESVRGTGWGDQATVDLSRLHTDRDALDAAPAFHSVPVIPARSAEGYGGSTATVQEESDNEMGFGLFVDGPGQAVGNAGNRITDSLAGSDTYGFTTTYELPTPRTIPSSSLVRRHVIAEIPLRTLFFTHILIPKLKAAAFLKAKVTNTSSIPLLKGPAGLTLDGSFMGNLTFPRCSPSETITLELGVDQSVKVEYERPTVKHGTQGMIIMGKEEVGIYKRIMRITNSKLSTVSLVVLDQVPQPEDERLKVTILAPKGLKDVDDVVKHGVGTDGNTSGVGGKKKVISPPPSSPSKLDNVAETSSVKHKTFSFGKRDSTFGFSTKPDIAASAATLAVPSSSNSGSGSGWGAAKASLNKNGEIRWDVDLLKGGCVALGLEWECRMPSGDGVHELICLGVLWKTYIVLHAQ